jgi:hypothetical protein
MSQQYFSELEGYTDCFITVTDKWTVKEMRSLADSEEKEYFEIFQKKVEGMLLRDADGVELRNPAELDGAALENFDVSLAGFVGSILPLHVRRRRNLGGMNVRPLSTSKDGEGSQKNK